MPQDRVGEPPRRSRDELVSYLDDLLDAHLTSDVCPNGLQVEGRATIGRIISGVSACQELFRVARQRAADAVLVHHGIFWRGDPPTLIGFRRQRVAELLAGDVNLIAYHLPLDRHPELGNNAIAARELGLEEVRPFGHHENAPLGTRGHFPESLTVSELQERCRRVFGQAPQVFAGEDRSISTIGIISGAAQREFYTAIESGLDAFVTGESSEWVVNLARETGVVYVAAGHYATERLGIRALGEHVAEQFRVEVEFVDVPNPV